MNEMDDTRIREVESLLRPVLSRLRKVYKLEVETSDLAQECLIRLITGPERDPTDLYLFKVAKTVCLDQMRRQMAEKRLSEVPPEEPVYDSMEEFLDLALRDQPWTVQKGVRLRCAGETWEKVASEIGLSLEETKRILREYVTDVTK